MTVTVVLNIVGSVIAAVLLILLARAWSRFIMPLIDRTIAIEGDWLTDIVFPDGEKNRHRITLRRFGHTVWGDAICEEGWGQGFRYKISGTFKNLVLAAQYEIVGRQRVERGSFTLMLIEGGSRLKGYLAYLDNDTNGIEAARCEWLAQEVPDPRARSTRRPGTANSRTHT